MKMVGGQNDRQVQFVLAATVLNRWELSIPSEIFRPLLRVVDNPQNLHELSRRVDAVYNYISRTRDDEFSRSCQSPFASDEGLFM